MITKTNTVYSEDNMNTPYDFRFHAEIQYETDTGFMMCNANGNSIDELLWDIDDRFDYYKHRQPKILTVLLNPNKTRMDITEEITEMFNKKKGEK